MELASSLSGLSCGAERSGRTRTITSRASPRTPKTSLQPCSMETLKVFQFSKTNLTVSAALLTALSQPGRVYFNTNASYYVKLFSNLKWNALLLWELG